MAYMMNQLNSILQIVMVVMLVVGGLVLLWIFLWQKKRKRSKINEDTVDYSNFNRADTADYIKIDDIDDNMIIVEDGTRFIGVLECHGFDYELEHPSVQAATCSNYFSFINTITSPITYRQYGEPIDLEDTLDMYKQAYDKLSEEIFDLKEDTDRLVRNQRESENSLTEDERNLYEEQIKKNVKKMESLEFRKYHMEDQMRVIGNSSGSNTLPNRVETYVFEWQYDPYNFSIELSKDEVHKRAIDELASIARAKIHALANCNVKAYRCNTEQLIEMCRRYSGPKSAERYKLRDVLKSTYFEDINTSNSLERMNRDALDIMGIENETLFNEKLQELQKNETKVEEDVSTGQISPNEKVVDVQPENEKQDELVKEEIAEDEILIEEE